MDLTSKEYYQKVLEMGAPEKAAEYATIFNCYCRSCLRAYDCINKSEDTDETIVFKINKKNMSCPYYEYGTLEDRLKKREIYENGVIKDENTIK